ncbi:MAG TPA: hypothetical protein VGJ21_18990 [Terracidiphilus sp.]
MPTPEAAVQRCLDAYNRACERDDARNDYTPESLHRVGLAWREAMPFLTNDPDAIDAFIACVTHGIVIGVFQANEGSKLLYAARVAIAARRARHEAARQHAKSSQQQAPTPTPSPMESLTPPATPNPASPAQAPPPPTPSSDSTSTPADAQPQAPPTPLPPRKQPAAAPAARSASQNQVEAILNQLNRLRDAV